MGSKMIKTTRDHQVWGLILYPAVNIHVNPFLTLTVETLFSGRRPGDIRQQPRDDH